MSDPIKTQATIDMIERYSTWSQTYSNMVEDAISRKAAIDALGDEPYVWTEKDEYAMGLNNQWHYDRNAIKAVPSAQPEKVCIANITLSEEQIREAVEKAKEELKNSPILIEPEQQWIPCSETEDLPEHEVLCCDKYGEELIGWLSYSDDQWLCESECEIMYDPIAWRELPEPWRGEEHETD